ncbi:hypothetical protein TRFO_19438 [Tritrichomonas foetus]|uniref:BEACH domain-containing protein n=1 Tax=Tritrichomonas foetus TaxID=1144522 RepID=A0A1J4KI30_9EUKA|nr:hypothetical protein TRFO_19438 [Tritrichomonas foetus]|eukprot:OHT11039.1 hypothetical protein TRFO_19438 [Tritrichomonas foetus]
MFKKKADVADPILEGLMANQNLLDSVKLYTTFSDKISTSPEILSKILSIANTLNAYFDKVGVHPVQQNSCTLILNGFLLPLFEAFSIMDKSDKRLEEIMLCISTMYDVTGLLNPLSSFQSIKPFFYNLFPFYQTKHSFRETLTQIVSEMIHVKQIYSTMLNFDFINFLYDELFSNQQLTDSACWFTELFISNFDRNKPNSIDLMPISNKLYSMIDQESIPRQNIKAASMFYSFISPLNFLSKEESLLVFSPTNLLKFCHFMHLSYNQSNNINYNQNNNPENNFLNNEDNNIYNNLNNDVRFFIRNMTYLSQIVEKGSNFNLNSDVVCFMLSQIGENSLFSKYFFLTFLELFENMNIPFSSFESICSVPTLFQIEFDQNSSSHILVLMSMFQSLAKRHNEKVFCLPECLAYLIDKIVLQIDYPNYSSFYQLITNLLKKEILHVNEVATFHFFSSFVFNLKKELFKQMLQNNSQYRILLYKCYSSLENNKKQWEVLKAVYSIEELFEKQHQFIKIASPFFSGVDSSFIMVQTLQYITDHQTKPMMNLLITTFRDHEEDIDLFLQNSGLTWFNNEIIPNASFDDQFISNFINSLVSRRTHDSVSIWISSLKSNHRIFKMPYDILWFLAFGTNKSVKPTTIRIPALLHLLDLRDIVFSPWNSAYAAKLGLQEFIKRKVDVTGNTLIDQMANYCVSSEQFLYLLDNSKNRANFINTSYSHFPMFEFVPNSLNANFTVKVESKAVAFWFKVDGTTISDEKVSLMTSDVVSLSFNATNLFVTRGNETIESSIQPSQQWIFIALSIINDYSFVVNVNGKTAKGNLPKPMSFTYLRFGPNPKEQPESISSCRWFIGSSVRFSKSPLNDQDLMNLQQEGPSYMSSSQKIDDNFVITPFSSRNSIKSSGVLTVPYSGFSFYARRRRYFHLIVMKILKSNDIEDIEDLIKLLLNLFTVNRYQIRYFWIYMKTILKEKHSIIPDRLLKIILSYFHRNGFKEWFSAFYNDLDLWVLHTDIWNKSITKTCLEMPKFPFILFSMLTWSTDSHFRDALIQIILRFNNPIIYSLISFYLIASDEQAQFNFLSKLDDEYLKNFPIEGLYNLMLSLPLNITSILLDKFCIISANNPDYIPSIDLLGYIFSRGISQKHTWFQAFSLLCGIIPPSYQTFQEASIEGSKEELESQLELFEFFKDKKIERQNVICPILSLIFYSLCDAIHNGQIKNDLMFDAMKIIILFFDNSPKLFLTHDFLKIINYFAPILFDSNLVSEILSDMKDELEKRKQEDHILFSLWGVPSSILSESLPEPFSPSKVFQKKSSNMKSDDFFSFITDEQYNALISFYVTLSMPSSVDYDALSSIFLYNTSQSKFCIDLLIHMISPSIMKRITNTVSRDVIFTVVSEGIHQKLFGNDVTKLYHSIFDLILYFVEKKANISTFVGKIRSILIDMFNVLNSEEQSILFEKFFEHSEEFYEQSKIFDSIEFLLLYTSLMKDPPFLLIEMQAKMAEQPPPDTPFTIFNGELFEEHRKRILKKTSEITLKLDSKFIHISPNIVTVVFKNITSFHLNLMLRKEERDFFPVWQMLILSQMQNPEINEWSKSFTLSGQAWPFQAPRVLSLSMHERLSVTRKTPFDIKDLKEKAPRLCPFLKSKMKEKIECLYPWKYTSFTSILNIQPHQFSQSFNTNPTILYQLFVIIYAQFGSIKETTTVRFLKRIDAFNCFLFITQTHFMILINSWINNKQIHLENTAKSPIIYRTFLESIEMGFYGDAGLFCGHPIIIVPFSTVIYATPHYYFHLPTAMLIYTQRCADFILIPGTSRTLPAEFIKKLENKSDKFAESIPDTCNPLSFLKKSYGDIHKMWKNRKISTYDFIMCMNFLSGRSFSDLSQYPVYPWVFGDIQVENGSFVYKLRDLSKPMGQQTLERAESFEKTFENSIEGIQYYYSGHYSTMSMIHCELIRIAPFTDMHWDLYQGFDVEDRIFSNFVEAYKSSSEVNQNDVSELFAEWFCLPEMFSNVNNIDLPEVLLPEVTSNQCQFTLLSRKQLETAQGIGQWMDLIFGYLQQGNNAVTAKNVFNPVSYQKPLPSDIDRKAVGVQLENWGQCPVQIAKKAIREPKMNIKSNFDNISIKKIHSDNKIFMFSELVRTVLINKSKTIIARISRPNLMLYFEVITQKHPSLLLPLQSQSQQVPNEKQAKLLDSHYGIFNRLFSSALNISISANGLFVVIDTFLAFSVVYRLSFNGKYNVIDSKGFPPILHTKPMISSINGNDFLCASHEGNKVVIWDFVRSVIHRIISFDQKVLDTSFDEYLGLLFVLCSGKLEMFSINGTYITRIELTKPTSLFIYNPQETSEMLRPIFVGFDDGKVEMMKYEEETNTLSILKTINSSLGPINNIGSYINKNEIIVKDKDNNCCVIYCEGS